MDIKTIVFKVDSIVASHDALTLITPAQLTMYNNLDMQKMQMSVELFMLMQADGDLL